jgi:hypothetical protein
MAGSRFLLCALALLAVPALPASARTILFIGNSFTFGSNSPVHYYRADSVIDLNGAGQNGKTVGGVPAIFKALTREAGLDYTVSLETVGGKGLDYHYAEKRALIDQKWDEVVMHGYSTLDQLHPGDPTVLVQSVKQVADLLRARNPDVKIHLLATWSRADQTYPDGKPWHGKPIQQMGKDLEAAYVLAARNAAIADVIPLGLAWNRAIDTGFAGENPYSGVPAGKVNLWSWDSYHASAYGYYLEALLDFGSVTGRDPRSLGRGESVAEDMGFSPEQTATLQQIAHDELAARH